VQHTSNILGNQSLSLAPGSGGYKKSEVMSEKVKDIAREAKINTKKFFK
jgi:hypothetical protein